MNNAKNTTLSPYLERLLDGEDVEWKTLGEVCDILRGKRLTKKELSEEGKYAVFHGGLVPIGFYSESNRKGDTTMVINVGASAGTIGYSRDDFWSSDGCFCISPSPFLLSRFIFYVLQSKDFQIKGKVRIAGIPTLDINVLEQFPIPIPPLRVQARIVEILDKFTQLEAELEKELAAELEARKKQYAYYRDQLLNFSQYPPLNVNVEWKTLGEVCDYEQPTAYLVRNTNYSDQYPIPVLTAGKTFILGYTNETTGIYRASEHPTIIFDDFTTANKWVDFDFKAKSSAMKMLTSKDEKVCLLKYIYYWLNTLPADSIVGDHSRQWISNYAQKLFPLPPLSEQRRIVDILDRFDTLTNSISEGLPKEIALRRKQYEYYRDALLNFPRAEVTV